MRKYKKYVLLGDNRILLIDLRGFTDYDMKSFGCFKFKAMDEIKNHGCDQVIGIRTRSYTRDIILEIYNKDGSNASMCGNGILAAYHLILGKRFYSSNGPQNKDKIFIDESGYIDDTGYKVGLARNGRPFVVLPCRQITGFAFEYDIPTFSMWKIGHSQVQFVANLQEYGDYQPTKEQLVGLLENEKIQGLAENGNISLYLQEEPEEIGVPGIHSNIKSITHEVGAGFTGSCGSAAAAIFADCLHWNLHTEKGSFARVIPSCGTRHHICSVSKREGDEAIDVVLVAGEDLNFHDCSE